MKLGEDLIGNPQISGAEALAKLDFHHLFHEPQLIIPLHKGAINMEELLELKTHIQNKDYKAALGLVEELEEMSREDKINKIDSFLIILLLHLIKQDAENRSTRSWDRSIDHAVRNINKTNKRRNAGSFYLNQHELNAAIDDAYPVALKDAAVEACEGQFTDKQLAKKVQAARIKEKALKLILEDTS